MSSDESQSSSIPTLKAEATGTALTPGQLVWRRFRKHRIALIGGAGIILLLIFIIIGSIIIPLEQANSVDLAARLSPPSNVHWFGTGRFPSSSVSWQSASPCRWARSSVVWLPITGDGWMPY
jgi:hypothetical protein